MKKHSFLISGTIAVLLVVSSCAWLDEGARFSRSRLETGPPAGGDRGTSGTQASPDEGALMVTVVEYPEGYCWQRDSSGDAGECRISLYCNGARIISVPSGASYPSCHAPDMHRCVDGKLYSDCSSALETSVYENGNLLFSYEGREMLCGFLIKDGDIYTLGQNRSGEGLSFRKNGALLYSSATGTVTGSSSNPSSRSGALYEDGESLVFCFRSTSVAQGSAVTSYYIVRDGVPEKLSFPKEVKSVYDIRQIGGRIVASVEHISEAKSPALIVDGALKSLPLGIKNIKIGGCDLRWHGDEEIFLNATFSGDGWKTIRHALVWRNSGKLFSKLDESIYDYWICGSDYAYPSVKDGCMTLVYSVRGAVRKIDLNDGRYSIMSASCMMFDEGGITAGLSPRDSAGFPLIVRGSRVEKLKVNGYVTSVGYY